MKTLLHTSKKISPQELINDLKSGDDRAFSALYKCYGKLFTAIAFRYTKNEMDASDVVQEAFLKIFKNIRSYTGKGNFEGWMKRILMNCCYDFVQRRSIHVDLAEEETWSDSKVLKQETITSKMAVSEILKLVDRLPQGYKKVFMLNVVEGHDHREIGEMLGISPSASRSQLTKAKSQLRSTMHSMQFV